MIKLFLNLFLYLNFASASEQKKAGTVLNQDSMVFSVEEAKDLQKYISKIEIDNINKDELIIGLKQLIENKSEQIANFEEFLLNKEEQLKIYKDLRSLDQEYIKKIEKKNNFKKLEVIGAFTGGAVLTTALMILADQIDDKIIE